MDTRIQNKMKNRLLGLIFIVIIISLACNAITPQTPSSNVSSEPVLKVNPPTDKVESLPSSISVDGWITFTGKDNLYKIDIPKNWLTGHWIQDGLDYLIDNFQSSDSKSYLEVFISDDGRPFPAVDEKYTYALSVLERLYSKGVKVEKRTIEENGKEVVIWNSQNKRYVSVYDVANKTTFIMLTIFGYTPENETSKDTKEIINNFKIQQNTTSEPSSEIEYSSVAEALAKLSNKEGIKLNVSQGWTIITEDDGAIITMWSFAPEDSPAYPAVAKRVFYDDQGGWYVVMSILCEANKEECDKFNQDFVNLNEEMRKYVLKDQLRKYLEELQGK
jgi:hypothetical protein